jgi:1-deoxy-D-xylulose-5-phosphate synthase
MDRSGIVGEDGPTHHGLFDISFLRAIPNIVIISPATLQEFKLILKEVLKDTWQYPTVIRYPRFGDIHEDKIYNEVPEIQLNKGVVIKEGKDLAIFAIGKMVSIGLQAVEIIKRELVLDAALINARFIKPLDTALLEEYGIKRGLPIVTVEEHQLMGGFGSAVLETLNKTHKKTPVLCIGIEDNFVEHGAASSLYEKLKLDPKGIADRIINFVHELNLMPEVLRKRSE